MKRLSLFVALLSLFSCSSNQSSDGMIDLFDSNILSMEQLSTTASDVKIIEEQGAKKIVVKSKDTFNAEVTINSPKDQPWDLSDSYQVMAEVSNTGKNRAQVSMSVGLDPDPLMRWYCSNIVDLEPGETKTVYVDLTWLDWVHSTPIDLQGMRGVPGQEKTDRTKVQQVVISSNRPTESQEFTISDLYAIGITEVRDPEGFLPFVNTYGQYKHDEWVNKIHSDEDLLKMAELEQADLKKYPQAPATNEYGGWTDGPKQEATGYFYPKKVDGKWWLVDPTGCLFWSAGVNCVSYGSVNTNLTGREDYFEDLPAESGATEQFYIKGRGGKGFNHYTYNMYRMYGDDYNEKYCDLTNQRFASWGLNTMSFAARDLSLKHKTPYVSSVRIRSTCTIEGSSGYWGKFHDVFSPDFDAIVKECVDTQIFGANDPWCIGYFVDNELSWGEAGSLSVATLISPADQPAKIKFVADLKAKYKNIAALNSVWGTNHASWDALLQCTVAPDETKAQEDLYAFYDKIAIKYFKTVHDELERVAPKQAYLGCRLAWAQNIYTMGAAATYCDIISFNKYDHSVEYQTLPEGIDRPILIGEFHFGALDRGMFHRGVKWALDQEDRGVLYQNYIRSALRNDLIVGAHWFQYHDEALTGRSDGENYNIGLINVANVTYPELVNKVRETCYDKYNYRYNR